VTHDAIATVRRLMEQMLGPLGGLGGSQTAAFVRELTALLDVPLDPQVTDPKE
jgi:MarR family transcriptional regulator, organic hydroperoxide resistance regulator